MYVCMYVCFSVSLCIYTLKNSRKKGSYFECRAGEEKERRKKRKGEEKKEKKEEKRKEL